MSPRDETTRAKHAEVLEKVRIASDYWELKAIKDKAAMERKALLSRADSSYAVAVGKTYVRRIFKNLKAKFQVYCKEYAKEIDELYYATSTAPKPDVLAVDVMMKARKTGQND